MSLPFVVAAIAFASLLEEINQSQINAFVYLMGIYDGRAAWGCNGKAPPKRGLEGEGL